MVKAVIDTNVFISAIIIKKSIPREIFNLFRKKKYELTISPLILAEIIKTLEKPKIKRYIKDQEPKDILAYLQEFAEFVSPEEKVSACRDRKDNIILECALAGKVDFIITGDNDLLILKTFHNIEIITPKLFLDKLS
jgi:putative PIN family toxin of toxin-antitoxin system